jgi:hypothetical protein
MRLRSEEKGIMAEFLFSRQKSAKESFSPWFRVVVTQEGGLKEVPVHN